MGDDATSEKTKTALRYFNPRPPHGGRPSRARHSRQSDDFNPRPPHGGRRQTRCASRPARADFNPRPPHGGRRGHEVLATNADVISIHVPRTGDDPMDATQFITLSRFQSTSPVRGTTWCYIRISRHIVFQSTSPVRGTTRYGILRRQNRSISIHVPRTGDDAGSATWNMWVYEFQSTSPARGTTYASFAESPRSRFQSASPARGTTKLFMSKHMLFRISIHVPRAGDDSTSAR